MHRYLITGASSYPGKNLTTYLLDQGLDVHVLARPETKPERLAGKLKPNQIHAINGQTENIAEVIASIDPDVVFHLASIYRREASPADVQPLVDANILFGVQLCEALSQSGKQIRFINTGTFAQYYESKTPRALSLYAALKQAFDDILAYYRDAHGFLTTTLILHDVYGPRDWREKLIAAVSRAQKSGEPLPLPDEDMAIDLVYIDDVIRAFGTAAQLLYDAPDSVNAKHFYVGSGNSVHLSDVVTMFEKINGRTIKTKSGVFNLPKRRITVPWRGEMLPGWVPETSLEQGIRNYLSDGGGS